MLGLPSQLRNGYARLLKQRDVPQHSHNYYLKWLRFYLDFCKKYDHAPAQRSSLPPFIKKLHGKNQTIRQQKEASHAINLYYALKNTQSVHGKANPAVQFNGAADKTLVAVAPEKAAWEQIYTDLDAAIKVRHYSPKTYKTYAGWIRKLQYFTQEKAPELLTGATSIACITCTARI